MDDLRLAVLRDPPRCQPLVFGVRLAQALEHQSRCATIGGYGRRARSAFVLGGTWPRTGIARQRAEGLTWYGRHRLGRSAVGPGRAAVRRSADPWGEESLDGVGRGP